MPEPFSERQAWTMAEKTKYLYDIQLDALSKKREAAKKVKAAAPDLLAALQSSVKPHFRRQVCCEQA